MTNITKTSEEYALEREERDRNKSMIYRHLNRKFPNIPRKDDRVVDYLRRILVRGDNLLKPLTKKNIQAIRTESSYRLGAWYNKPGPCGYRLLFPGAVSYELNPGESTPSAHDIADKIRQGVDGVSPSWRNNDDQTLFFSPGSYFDVTSAISNPEDCTKGSFELRSGKYKAKYNFERVGESIRAFFVYFETNKGIWDPMDV